MTAEINPGSLFERDETAWLDVMADAARRRDPQELDWANLGDYLSDMAQRDRRQVRSRLVFLLMHLLKWEHQSEKRTPSWRSTILLQKKALIELASDGVLRRHAESVLADCYVDALELAVEEMGLFSESFPKTCPDTLEQLFEQPLPPDRA